jgi:hypothetical protein
MMKSFSSFENETQGGANLQPYIMSPVHHRHFRARVRQHKRLIGGTHGATEQQP